MVRAWVTNSSTTLEAMVNPLNAACDGGFVPDRLYLLENPGVTEQVQRALDLIAEITTAYGSDEPEIRLTTLDNETDFNRISTYFADAISEVRDDGGEVAVDITPGRKFMSAIAFAAGMRYEADHVYYFYISPDQYGQIYPDMPRTAMQLYDIREAL